MNETQRVCAVRWQVPAPPGSGRSYIEHTATVNTVEELFALIEKIEREVYVALGVVSAVCLDDPSGECLYVGSAGAQWSLYYLRMPEHGGELFARPVGNPEAEGTTEVIEEMGEQIANAHFVSRAAGQCAVREWWESKSLWAGIVWDRETD